MRQKMSWVALTGLAVAAVILLRVERSYSLEVPPPADPEDELKYICVGDIAVELGADKNTRYRHDLNLELPSDTLKQRCRPPLPRFNETTLSVTSPLRGYAAVVELLAAPPEASLQISKRALEAEGWRETPGSVELGGLRPDLPVMAFVRGDDWLMTAAVSAPDKKDSYLLMAGEWPGMRGE